jgi:hypothetical protein
LKLLPIDYERCCIDRLNTPPQADIVGVNAMNFSVAKVAFIPEGELVAT